MDDLEQLLLVMEDARKDGNTSALAELGRELSALLGVSEAGGDEYGLWCRFEVTGGDGATASARMRWLWPGRFLMGSPQHEVGRRANEGPVHEVVLTRGLWLGETTVTQALYQAVMGTNPSSFRSADRPVEQVGWEDARRLCDKLGERFSGLRPRLPSEAEWEYACRAGTTTATYAGDLGDIAWYHDNSTVDGSRSTHPVAALLPNAWGLYDMLGNVWEWCEDRTDLGPYQARTQYDPLGTTGSSWVFRGSSWSGSARFVRAACRFARGPDFAIDDLGFRLAGGPPPESEAKEQTPPDGADKAGTSPASREQRGYPTNATPSSSSSRHSVRSGEGTDTHSRNTRPAGANG